MRTTEKLELAANEAQRAARQILPPSRVIPLRGGWCKVRQGGGRVKILICEARFQGGAQPAPIPIGFAGQARNSKI